MLPESPRSPPTGTCTRQGREGVIHHNMFIFGLRSMEIKPMGSDKYELIYKSGQMTQKYEFTMTDKKIEYGQFKAWRDNKSMHFAWTTEDGVPQTFDIKYDQKFVTFTVDFK